MRTAAVGVAVGLVVVLMTVAGAAPVEAGRGAATVLAQSAGSEVERARQAMEAAEERVNEIQRDLEAALERSELAQAQRQAATELLEDAGVQEQELQFAIGIRARSTYMQGAPTSVARIVNADDPDGLLDRVAVLEQLARIDNLTIQDLQTVQELAQRAEADLAAAEEAAASAAAALEAKLEEAEAAYEERVAVFNELNADVAREAADDLAAERDASVTDGDGGVCDLSGVPAAAREIIMRESGGRPTAQNPTSTAFGLGQLLLGNRLRLLGDNYATTDCALQYQAFEQYVLERYGSFDAALAFHNERGWY